MRFLHAVVVTAVAVGCAHSQRSATAVLERAADEAKASGASARVTSLAGFHALLLANDVGQAKERFEAALKQDAAEPYALFGLALLAQRDAQQARGVMAALDLCERAGTHPLAVPAARLVFDVSGRATSLDDTIAERGQKILAEHRVSGDAEAMLRGALANVFISRQDRKRRDEMWRAMGVPTEWAVLGPLSPYHVLELQTPLPQEKTGTLAATVGPLGPIAPRVLKVADGRLSLAPEPKAADVFIIASDATVPEDGVYVVRTVTSMDHVLLVDGIEVARRRTWESPASTVTAIGVKLTRGTHRFFFKVARDEEAGSLFVSVSSPRAGAADITWAAATGAPPRWSSGPADPVSLPQGFYPTASSLTQALEPEAGLALAALIAAQDGLSRDRDAAKALLDSVPNEVGGATRRFLAAELNFADRTVPAKVARGRGTRELEATLEADPKHLAALLLNAQLALDDGRHLEALELIGRARALTPTASAALLQARVELALGVDAQADVSAKEAERLLPGLCEAMALRGDLAARRDAVADADAIFAGMQGCSSAGARQAEHFKARGNLAQAAARYELLLSDDETNVPVRTALVGVYVAQRRYDDAAAAIEKGRAIWPLTASLPKMLGDVLERKGAKTEALKARQQALALDGGDLALRRHVERALTGKELLDAYAISTDEALKAYAAAPGNEDAPGAYVLDAAAVKVYPDGSMVDRIHIIQKALDQSGLQDIAEVEVPSGAYLLKMRTLKADGTVLEPESIEGKDAVSLPGVQPGDFVEYEYLMAHAPRGPAQPGFTASSFYFQIARQPNNWSTYKVVAPLGTGLTVDAHNMKSAPPQVAGDEEVYAHEERAVPPYIPEPNGPPSGSEWLPFVSVGAGQKGNDGVVATYADAFVDSGQVTYEVSRFAAEAVKGLSPQQREGKEAVAALYAAVMQKLSGRDAGLSMTAGASVAQDRGSRLMLLYAGLKALGLSTRMVAVRTFSSDPAKYLYPNEALLPYLCVRVQLKGGDSVWLDPVFRFGPFGELPDVAADREAYLLPEPGKPLEAVRTPKQLGAQGKQVTLTLTLDERGQLSGTGVETYRGFGAAQLAEALEALSPEQREQALQSALSRYFGGAELSGLTLSLERKVGAPVEVKYSFVASRFARVEGEGKLVLGSPVYPVLLGRRYLQLSQRSTPLFLESTEETSTQVKLTLPEGYKLVEPLPEVKSNCPYGSFVHREQANGRVVTIDEHYRIEMARVPPKDYERFGVFAGEVDLVQGRDLLAQKN